MQAQQMSVSIQTCSQMRGKKPADIPVGGVRVCYGGGSGRWEMILLAPDAAEERTRNIQYYEHDTSK